MLCQEWRVILFSNILVCYYQSITLPLHNLWSFKLLSRVIFYIPLVLSCISFLFPFFVYSFSPSFSTIRAIISSFHTATISSLFLLELLHWPLNWPTSAPATTLHQSREMSSSNDRSLIESSRFCGFWPVHDEQICRPFLVCYLICLTIIFWFNQEDHQFSLPCRKIVVNKWRKLARHDFHVLEIFGWNKICLCSPTESIIVLLFFFSFFFPFSW